MKQELKQTNQGKQKDRPNKMRLSENESTPDQFQFMDLESLEQVSGGGVYYYGPGGWPPVPGYWADWYWGKMKNNLNFKKLGSVFGGEEFV